MLKYPVLNAEGGRMLNFVDYCDLAWQTFSVGCI